MLAMRARAFNFRDQFADALRGIGIAEEVQDIPAPAPTRPPVSLQDFSDDPPENIIEATAEPVAKSGNGKPIQDDEEIDGETANRIATGRTGDDDKPPF